LPDKNKTNKNVLLWYEIKPNSSQGGDGKPRVLKRQPGCLRDLKSRVALGTEGGLAFSVSDKGRLGDLMEEIR